MDFFFHQYLHYCGTVVQWLALSPHSKKVLGSILSQGIFVEFVCFPCVCMGFLWILRLPPPVQKHTLGGNWLFGYSILIVGVKASVDGHLSLNVNPAINCQLVQGDPTYDPTG